eukprot:459302_1
MAATGAWCFIYRSISSFLFLLAALLLIWCTYQFIKQRANTDGYRCLYYTILFQFIGAPVVCILCMLVHVTNGISCSIDKYIILEVNSWLQLLTYAMYGIQWLVLLIILFWRLVIVFKNTHHQVSRQLIYVYGTLYILIIINAALAIFVMDTADEDGHNTIDRIILISAFTICLALYAILIAAFVSRLYQIQKKVAANTDPDDTTQRLIAKMSILTFISIITTIVFGVCTAALTDAWDNPVILILFNIIMIIDIMSNYLSVWLQYECFDGYYSRLCSCFHRVKYFRSKPVNELNISPRLQMQVTAETTKDNQSVSNTSFSP